MNTNIPPIEKVFVLMLENRSFDHMLGFAGIQGTDVITGKTRSINGLAANQYFNRNSRGQLVYATPGAPYSLTVDPGHEFEGVCEQLCGPGAVVDPVTGAYPKVSNSGFLLNYQGSDNAVMKCFGPMQLPVLDTLAREFAVCDAWYSSLPGATWPNRFFWHAASSGGMVESASNWAMFNSTLFHGYSFQHGTIFDLLDAARIDWCIYEGDAFPQSFAMKGMTWQWIKNGRFKDFTKFAADVSDKNFSPQYVFIEPNYGRDILPPQDFHGGNSQHPLDDVLAGEALIKAVYEAVRTSPHWERSVLVITYDEHGGFYDHVAPPDTAVSPGDASTVKNQPRFDFRQYGVRVPTVVISPYTAQNLIDSTIYDHASFLRSLELLFDLPTLTDRDANASDFVHLLRSVQQPRRTASRSSTSGPPATTGSTLIESQGGGLDDAAPETLMAKDLPVETEKRSAVSESEVDSQPLKGHHYDWLHVAFLRDLAIRQHDESRSLALDQLRRDVTRIRTIGQGREYMKHVRDKVHDFKGRMGLR